MLFILINVFGFSNNSLAQQRGPTAEFRDSQSPTSGNPPAQTNTPQRGPTAEFRDSQSPTSGNPPAQTTVGTRGANSATYYTDARYQSNLTDINRLESEISTLRTQLDTATPAEAERINNSIEQKQNEISKLNVSNASIIRNNQAVANVAEITRGNSNLDCGWDFACHAANITYHVVFVPSAALMTASGRLFDYVMIKTVVEMKETLFQGDPNSSSIQIAWETIRDYVNIMFIFILLWIAIKTIINGTSGAGRDIVKVIVVALLINFSLLFTKAFIDIGNVLSISMYNKVSGNTDVFVDGTPYKCPVSKYVVGLLGGDTSQKSNSISCAIISNTGVASSFSNITGSKVDYMGIIIKSIGGAFLMVIIAIILFTVSFMLIGRLIVLAFVLFLSAAAFGGYMLPQLEGMITNPWKKALVGQTFFPFVLLLMLDISLSMMGRLTTQSSNGWSSLDVATMPNIIFSYVIIVGLLIASITVAKKVSDSSGAAAGKITSFTKGAAIGAAAWAGRGTLGRVGRYASKNVKGNNWASRAIKRSGNYVADRSFDLRNAPGMKFAKKLDSDLGAGNKKTIGGFNKTSDTRDKNTSVRLDARQKFYGAPTTGEEREKAKLERELVKNNEIRSAAQKEIDEKTKALDIINNDLKENSAKLSDSELKNKAAEIDNLKKELEASKKKITDADNNIVASKGFMGKNPKLISRKEADDIITAINKGAGERSKSFVGRMDTLSPRTRKWSEQKRSETLIGEGKKAEMAQDRMLKAMEKMANQASSKKEE